MTSGRLLFEVLVLLTARFLFLCGVLAKLLGRQQRTWPTIAGLGCSTVAVASLLALHLSWVSPEVSQRVGIGGIRVLALLLFWPTLAALIFSVAGSGTIRFLGIASAAITGLWWASLAVEAGMSMGAPMVRHPTQFSIPNGYVGWVEVKYGEKNTPPLPMKNGVYVCTIPPTGVLTTSSSLEEGWAKDEYVYYSENGATHGLKVTNWGLGGMIWGETLQSQAPVQFAQRFYVGTEEQFRHTLPFDERRYYDFKSDKTSR